jgi:hypothetical protein
MGVSNIKVEAWDDTEDSGKINPVVKWVHTILELWPTNPLMGRERERRRFRR